MKTRNLHSWNLSYPRAIQLQKKLALSVEIAPLKKEPKLVAGLDCAFTKDGKKIVAAVIVLKLPDFELIETQFAVRRLKYPYIPGLLSFREAPACIAAVKKLKNTPDLFLIDGQGIAHPRRLGLAAHLGLFFDKPAIGCAKSRLIGTFKQPPVQKGSYSWLKNEKGTRNDTKHEVIGAVVRSRTNVKPLFISVGNKCTLANAIKFTLACTGRYRLPEPVRLAHKHVSGLKTEL